MSAPTIKDGVSLLVRKIAAAPRPLTWGHLRSIFRELAALGKLDFDPEDISVKEYAAIAKEINSAEARR